MDIDPETVVKSPFFVGALGALVAAIKALPGTTWIERLGNIVAGALFAGYLNPAFVEWAQIKTPGMVNGCAFIAGLLGMSLASAMLEAAKNMKLADFIAWLPRRKE